MFVSWRGDHASFNLAAEGQPCRNSKGVRRGFYSTVITVSFQEHKERKAPLGWAKSQSLSVTQLSSWFPPERKWFWDDDGKKPTTSFPTFLWYVWIMSRNAFICSQMTHFQEKKASYKRKAYLEFKLKKGTEHTHTWHFFIVCPQCEHRFIWACIEAVDKTILCTRLKNNKKKKTPHVKHTAYEELTKSTEWDTQSHLHNDHTPAGVTAAQPGFKRNVI